MDPQQIFHILLVIMSATIVMTTYPYFGITYKAKEYGTHGKYRMMLIAGLFVFIALVYSQYVVIWIGSVPLIPADFLVMSVAFMFGPVIALPVAVTLYLVSMLMMGMVPTYSLLVFCFLPLLLGTVMWIMSNKKCPGVVAATIMMVLSTSISTCVTYMLNVTPPDFFELALVQIFIGAVPMALSIYFYHNYITPEVAEYV
mgnify:CR=1 FL=1